MPKSSRSPDISQNLIDGFEITKDAAEALANVPYVKAVAGVAGQVLQIREDLKRNKEAAGKLIDAVRDRSKSLFNNLARYAEDGKSMQGTNLEKTLQPLEEKLKEYKTLLEEIYKLLEQLKSSMSGLTQAFRRGNVKDELETLQRRLAEYDITFLVNQMFHLRMDVISLVGSATSSGSSRQRVLVTPAPPSRHFTGRADILEHMRGSFFDNAGTGQKCYVLHGLGGSGKTQLALKFIDEHNTRFTRIYMIEASSRESITTYLEDIGIDAGISSSPKADDTLRWLAGLKEDWFLLLDNADDPQLDLYPFFPRCKHGNIIITTRNPECTTHAFPLTAFWHVSDLSEEDAVDLLLISSRNGDREAALDIIRELGCLALAVAQAGAFISKNLSRTFEGFLEVYRENRERLLRQGPSQRNDAYAYTVYTTWEMSYEKLGSFAKSFLQTCGFLHNEGIHADIFKEAVSNLKENPTDADKSYNRPAIALLNSLTTTSGGFDVMAFITLLTELASYSLIQPSTSSSFSIHPLVHSWSRDRLPEQERRATLDLTLSVLSLSISFDQDSVGYTHRHLLLPHLDAAIPKPPAIIDLDMAVRFVGAYSMERKWKSMVDLCQMIIERSRGSQLGTESSQALLRSKQLLSKAFWGQRKYAETSTFQLELVEECCKMYGPEHPDTLHNMASLGSSYHAQGRFDEAEPVFVEGLALMKRVLGDEHPSTLRCMSSLALTYYAQGRYAKAEPLQIETLALMKHVLGDEHPETLWGMADLAVTYGAQGRHVEAEPLEVQVIALRIHVHGDQHPDTFRAMGNLADTYQKLGRYSEGEPLAVAAYEGLMECRGALYPDTLWRLQRLKALYEEQERHEVAESLQVSHDALQRGIPPQSQKISHGLSRPEASLFTQLRTSHIKAHPTPPHEARNVSETVSHFLLSSQRYTTPRALLHQDSESQAPLVPDAIHDS